MRFSASNPLAFLILTSYACIVSANDTGTSNSDESPYDEEIKCYSLPYGGFGFLSHILTYYAITMLCLEKTPLAPGREVNRRSSWNIFLAIAKLILTSIPSIYTMVKCSHSWQFETIAAMKFALALASTLIGLFPGHGWLVLIYIPGVIAGTAGTISLAASNFGHSMMIITAVFGSLALACSLAAVIICVLYGSVEDSPFLTGILWGLTGYLAFIPFVVVFGALYSDWVLAIVGNNLVGYPYMGNKAAKALWVLYWIGKRLNLFMT